MRLLRWLHDRTVDTKYSRHLPRSIHAHVFFTRVRSTYLQCLQTVLRLALQHPYQRYVIYPDAFPREYICFYTDPLGDLSGSDRHRAAAGKEVYTYIDYPDPTAPEDLPALLYTCQNEERDLVALLEEWKGQSHTHAYHILNRYLDIDAYNPMDPEMNLVCCVYGLYAQHMQQQSRVLMTVSIPGIP